MSLLHATWLPATKAGPTATNGRIAAGLLLWADTWRVATPVTPTLDGVPDHPLSLNQDDLGAWLEELDLWSEDSRPAEATLTLPSRRQASRGRKSGDADGAIWSGLPLQAGEPLP